MGDFIPPFDWKKMARKEKSEGFRPSIRNRGEDIGYPVIEGAAYDHKPYSAYKERAVSRKEMQQRYSQMQELASERDQRAFARVKDARNEFYAGMDPRRKQELADGGMVAEDNNAMANLSENFVHAQYPRSEFYSTPYIDDMLRENNERFEE